MALNDAKLRTLKARDKPYKSYDTDDLFVLVAPSGTRLWRLKCRFNGKEKLLALGQYPEVTLKDALARAFVARQHIANGFDSAQCHLTLPRDPGAVASLFMRPS